MGVTGGWKALVGYVLKVSSDIKTFVSGKVVAVDGSCVGHKTSSIACTMEIAKDEQNIEVCTFKYDPLAHAAAVVSWLVYLSRKVKGIIVVFDGPDPPGKADVREARDQDKADAQVIVDDVSASPSSRFAAFKKTVRWGLETIDAIKKELTMYAVPWVQAPAEADAQMALLVREGYATVINTNDFDAISMCPDTPVWDTYSRGCNQQNFGRVYMPEGVEAIRVEVRKETGTPHEDDGTHLHDVAEDDDEEGDDEPAAKRAKVAHHFAETREKGLLWVASVISGCDYSPGIQGYGYARALGKVAESTLTKKSTLSDVRPRCPGPHHQGGGFQYQAGQDAGSLHRREKGLPSRHQRRQASDQEGDAGDDGRDKQRGEQEQAQVREQQPVKGQAVAEQGQGGAQQDRPATPPGAEKKEIKDAFTRQASPRRLRGPPRRSPRSHCGSDPSRRRPGGARSAT